MRRPTCRDFDNGDGTCDYEAYDTAMGDYEDAMYDEKRDRESEEGAEQNGAVMELTKENKKELRRAYDKAVKEKRDIFMFCGTEVSTGYAKYLLEYIGG